MPPVISPLPCDLTGSGETPKRKETARKILHDCHPYVRQRSKIPPFRTGGYSEIRYSRNRSRGESRASYGRWPGPLAPDRFARYSQLRLPRILLADSFAARLSVAERTNPPFPWLHRRLGEDHARKQLPTHCIGAACPVDIRLDRPGGRHGCAGSRIVVFPAGPTRQANTGNSSEHDSTEACLA